MHADITYKHWTGLNVFVNTIVVENSYNTVYPLELMLDRYWG